MRIVNGKRFTSAQFKAAKRIDDKGWDTSGRNKQWYSLLYNKDCGLVILDADNSGDYYGDYKTRYFDSPASFAEWCAEYDRDLTALLGNIDEKDEDAMAFVNAVFPEASDEQD